MLFFKRGSAPDGFVPIVLQPDYPLHNYQVKQSYPWASAPAHETRAALANCWTGNQLPGATNFIPNVAQSQAVWNVQTGYMNNPSMSLQLNKGMNIQSYTAYQGATLRQQVLQAWQNRTGY